MESIHKIQILIDNPKSWVNEEVKPLIEKIQKQGHDVRVVCRHEDVEEGDIVILLSCEKKFTHFSLNRHNLVVHASDLPQGKGWSPLTWQVIEGRQEIIVTLFEAADEIDAGKIYMQEKISLTGVELLPELHMKLQLATDNLIMRFIKAYPQVEGHEQSGVETRYRRRRPEDSELDPDKSIREQFNLLRVVDNERYPAFFTHQGVKFILKIEKADV